MLALLVTGCTEIEKIDAPLPSLDGEAASVVTARLGEPELQQVDGRTVHVWTVAYRTPATPIPTTRISYPTGVPNVIGTMSYPEPPRVETCRLRAWLDGAGNVVSAEWQGSRAACYDAARRIAGKP